MSLRSRISFFLLCFLCVGGAVWTVGCSGPGKDKEIVVRVLPSAFVNVGDKVTFSIQVKLSGKNAKDGTQIEVSANYGSFVEDDTKNTTTTQTLGGTAVVAWYVGDKSGTAKITVRSEGIEETVDVVILGKQEKVVQPEDGGSPEKVDELGPPEEDPFDLPPPPDLPVDAPMDGPPGSDNSLTLTTTTTKSAIAAGGVATTEIKVEITQPPLDVAEKKKIVLHFQTTNGTLLDRKTERPLSAVRGKPGRYAVRVGGDGFFRVLLRSALLAGRAEVSIEVAEPATYTGTSRAVIDFVSPGVLEFTKATPTIIGTQGSGRELSTVTFTVKDTERKPYPEGTKVFFRISQPLGGATVTKSFSLTGKNGEASTQIRSGQTAGTVSVNARVLVSSTSNSECPAKCDEDSDCSKCGLLCNFDSGKCAKMLEANSSSVAIVGGRPNYKYMTFSCDKDNIGALYGMVGNNITANINTRCSVRLGDRFTNKVGFATQVLFMTEAGTIDATAQTKPFSLGGPTENVGIALSSMRTQNPPPVDVLPMSVPNKKNCKGDPCEPDPALLKSHPFAWMSYDCTDVDVKTKFDAHQRSGTLFVEPYYFDAAFNRTRNPRDGLVSVVAYTNGEEEFADSNANGKYDPGEAFVDLGEPYLDVNDNGRYDRKLHSRPGGESFIDIPCTKDEVANGINGCTKVGVGNGRYDGPNGRWDANTLIWKKTWVVWSGCAVNLGTKSVQSPVKVGPKGTCKQLKFQSTLFPRTSFSLTPSKPAVYEMTIHDLNLNPLTSQSDVAYTGQDVRIVKLPASDKAHPRGGLGFTVVPVRFGTNIVNVTNHILPSSFWGISAISHKITLEDADGQENDKKPARFEIKISSRSAAALNNSCVLSLDISGETR